MPANMNKFNQDHDESQYPINNMDRTNSKLHLEMYMKFQDLTAGNQITLSLMTSLYRANQRVIIGKESYWAQQMKSMLMRVNVCAHV